MSDVVDVNDIEDSEAVSIGRGNVSQVVRVDAAFLNQVNTNLIVIRHELSILQSAVQIITITRDRLWFAMAGLLFLVILAAIYLDRQQSNLLQDVIELRRQVEILERIVDSIRLSN